MTLAEKIKKHRGELGISQTQLGNMVGVSTRSIAAYEMGDSKPREKVLAKLATALKVSTMYLESSAVTDPQYDIEKDGYISTALDLYGSKGAKDAKALLAQNEALFAGGSLDQEAKDAFFEAVMKAYITCKEEAKKTYGRKRKQKN